MPEHATYRVLIGPNMHGVHRFTRPVAKDFLTYYLLPRRRTDSPDARWILCYGCDLSDLNGHLQILADGGNGILFGRMRP
jgi:hypothetical protein